jgi:hypothetical protein
MEIKFHSKPFQVSNKYWTGPTARAFMAANNGSVHEAIRDNINFYKLTENGMLVHIYDAYEV